MSTEKTTTTELMEQYKERLLKAEEKQKECLSKGYPRLAEATTNEIKALKGLIKDLEAIEENERIFQTKQFEGLQKNDFSFHFSVDEKNNPGKVKAQFKGNLKAFSEQLAGLMLSDNEINNAITEAAAHVALKEIFS